MYALGIEADAVRDMCLGHVFPGVEFISALMRDTLNFRGEGQAAVGDIAIYLDNGAPRHAGKVGADGAIISKWGSGRTHVWRHGLWEIPHHYGDQVRFAKPLPVGQAIAAYREWAAERGL